MKIQNKALANTGLSIGGKVIEGDDEGVFDMPKDRAEQMLATPGWHPPIVEPEPAPAPEPEPEPETPEEPAGDAAEETTAETPEEEPSELTEAPVVGNKPKKKKRNPK